MYNAFFAGKFDITELVLFAFFLFFFGLVLYISRESRREGFPLENDVTGRTEPMPDFLFGATPKVFKLPHGMGTATAPNYVRDTMDINAKQTAGWSGAPFDPIGDPMQASVGPGAYANRLDIVDQLAHGGPRIVPLRADSSFWIDKADPNLIGMTVVGCDGKAAGVVSDIWVDRAEYLVRYLEVALPDANGRTVLVPMTMSVIQKGKKRIFVDAVTGAQFAGAPGLANPEQITRLEEERVIGYFGGGYLYATKERSEPVL